MGAGRLCYAGLATKYIWRDIEARMKPVAFGADTSEETGKGLWERGFGLVTGLRRWLRKEFVHG